ncbi:hypothetical protein SCHPADRAFT_493481 [Schizopora paradoxa]|uniref:Uncharacterized protein n=1 Tax=Schizopora paradoxa TaxID=27342 RepID=A0A0H2RHB9_9AGAM|nr:hypothetical protein SCHPADRAFT_493481 [Schizopora paradoxa]
MTRSSFDQALRKFTLPAYDFPVADSNGAGVFAIRKNTMGEIVFFEILGEVITRGRKSNRYFGRTTVPLHEFINHGSMKIPLEAYTSVQYHPRKGQIFRIEIRVAKQTRDGQIIQPNAAGAGWTLVATECYMATVDFPLCHRNYILNSLQDTSIQAQRSPYEVQAMYGLINLRNASH